jgi:N-acetylmuramoyl-L-alanine amidase
MKIENHLVSGDNVALKPSPNKSGKFDRNLPDTIIIHFTAGPSAQSAINTLTNPAYKVSAHLVIDFDGSITQLVPFDEIAWHAGVSSWENRTGLNKYSIGIEIVNPGNLTKAGDEYQAWFGKKYTADKVIKAVHRNENKPRYWHIYTPEQIDAVLQLCRLLTDTYDIKYILGHEEIAPLRKLDPGPAFPLNRLRDKILNNRKDNENDDTIPETGKVTASKLNIRESPDINSAKIAKPLPKNSRVEILDSKNGWYKVTAKITGWVAGKYINTDK